MAEPNTEIERKFLVNDLSITAGLTGVEMKQGYISTDADSTLRIRKAGDDAWVTIKNRPTGLKRLEFEYAIPPADAEHMLAELCKGVIIHKTRYTIMHSGKAWVLDIFHAPDPKLTLAEIELESEDEEVTIPAWVGKEVTGNPAYANSVISQAGNKR